MQRFHFFKEKIFLWHLHLISNTKIEKLYMTTKYLQENLLGHIEKDLTIKSYIPQSM